MIILNASLFPFKDVVVDGVRIMYMRGRFATNHLDELTKTKENRFTLPRGTANLRMVV